MSVHFGNSSAAAHRATAAREEDRQARAERVEAEGWEDLPVGEQREALHYEGDSFCECEACQTKEGGRP